VIENFHPWECIITVNRWLWQETNDSITVAGFVYFWFPEMIFFGWGFGRIQLFNGFSQFVEIARVAL
jgi:hypothetical protein